jgi:hypothetical protein
MQYSYTPKGCSTLTSTPAYVLKILRPTASSKLHKLLRKRGVSQYTLFCCTISADVDSCISVTAADVKIPKVLKPGDMLVALINKQQDYHVDKRIVKSDTAKPDKHQPWKKMARLNNKSRYISARNKHYDKWTKEEIEFCTYSDNDYNSGIYGEPKIKKYDIQLAGFLSGSIKQL